MDLSFALHRRTRGIRALPVELAVLLSGIAARQATSPTARLHAMIERVDPVVRRAPSAFNRATAAMRHGRTPGVKGVFT